MKLCFAQRPLSKRPDKGLVSFCPEAVVLLFYFSTPILSSVEYSTVGLPFMSGLPFRFWFDTAEHCRASENALLSSNAQQIILACDDGFTLLTCSLNNH